MAHPARSRAAATIISGRDERIGMSARRKSTDIGCHEGGNWPRIGPVGASPHHFRVGERGGGYSGPMKTLEFGKRRGAPGSTGSPLSHRLGGTPVVRQRSRLFILLMTLALTMGALLPAGVTGSARLPNYRPTAAPSWVTGPVDTSRPIDTSRFNSRAPAAPAAADVPAAVPAADPAATDPAATDPAADRSRRQPLPIPRRLTQRRQIRPLAIPQPLTLRRQIRPLAIPQRRLIPLRLIPQPRPIQQPQPIRRRRPIRPPVIPRPAILLRQIRFGH